MINNVGNGHFEEVKEELLEFIVDTPIHNESQHRQEGEGEGEEERKELAIEINDENREEFEKAANLIG